MDIYDIKVGQKIKVFDYGNDILDEIVLITMKDTISEDIVYQRASGEKIWFSGQGYFE